jgi:hypothetical protein
MYHVWGLCPHLECKASHDQRYRGLLETYSEQYGKYWMIESGSKVRMNDEPSETGKHVRNWKAAISRLFYNVFREDMKGQGESEYSPDLKIFCNDYSKRVFQLTHQYNQSDKVKPIRLVPKYIR